MYSGSVVQCSGVGVRRDDVGLYSVSKDESDNPSLRIKEVVRPIMSSNLASIECISRRIAVLNMQAWMGRDWYVCSVCSRRSNEEVNQCGILLRSISIVIYYIDAI